MEIGEIIGYIVSAAGGGGLMSVINWRINKRKAATEVKIDEIKALHDTIELVYEPLVKQLKERVADQDAEIASLRQQLTQERLDRQKEIEMMNKRILAIASALGMKAQNQIRDEKGRFVKPEPEDVDVQEES